MRNEAAASTSMTDQELLEEVRRQRELMIAVSTGGPRIASVNGQYQESRLRIARGLGDRGLEDPNPYQDLWAWYGKWSSGDLLTYASRRSYVNGVYGPLIGHLESRLTGSPTIPLEPTGWDRVDRTMDGVCSGLADCRSQEDFQAVGLRCREALISLAQAVYIPAVHGSLDGTPPGEADAKRMLEAFVEKELGGGANQELRACVRGTLKLAVALQHKRTAGFRDAALCAEATRGVVNFIAIVSGKRDPEGA